MQKKTVSLALIGTVLATGLTAVPAASAGTLKIGGSTGAALLVQTIRSSFNKTHSAQGVTAGPYAGVGSGAGINGANSGTFDIGGSSRDPRASDPKGLVFTPISKESIAVIVNPKNPICKKGLTVEQVKQIFTGVATSWSAVGGGAGRDRPAHPRLDVGHAGQLRDALPGRDQGEGLAALQQRGDPHRRRRNKNAVGAVTGAYIEGIKSVCGVKINGVAPTLKNTASGKFKYWTYQYLVTKGAPTGDAKTFVDYARSSAVQSKIVSKFAVPIKGVPPVNT